jgi:phage FluMu protein Com
MNRPKEIRCPFCNRKFGDRLEGVYETLCPRCKRNVHIERRADVDIKAVAV